MAVLFDTHAYHRTLTGAGVPADVAEAHARALELAMEGGLATKQDIQLLDQKLDQKIMQLDQKIELLSRDLKLWLGGGLVVAVGVILGAGKLIWN